MKYLFRIIFLIMPFCSIGQVGFDTNTIQLANRFFNDKEFEKAAELYKEVYDLTNSQGYFDQYVTCMIELGEYNLAEKEIRRELRKNDQKSYYYIQWGYLLKAQNRYSEADEVYQKALNELGENIAEYQDAARAFGRRGEFEYAARVYLLGREKIPGVDFYYDLARLYLIQRNYDSMMLEYLDWLEQSENNLPTVKMGLQSIYRADIGEEVSQQIKSILIKRIQQQPGIDVFNRLLIWLLVQDKNFPAALRQSITLDKRTSDESLNILELAKVASNNGNYNDAENAYNYLLQKGDKSKFYIPSLQQRMQMYYEKYLKDLNKNKEASVKLKDQFEETFKIIGQSEENTELMVEYAHLTSFHLHQPEQAKAYLEEALKMPRLSINQRSAIKSELGDISVFIGDFWGAILIYSQVIEDNQSTSLGDDVKLKKARLGYFMGNFEWSKAMLEALRASTSKLIANDAMELSLFIGNNLNLDTTAVPLRMFARADFEHFRNNDSLALKILDSLETMYPYHSLADDLYYRKAQIFLKQGNTQNAEQFLNKIISEFRFDMLCDDAIMMLAGIYESETEKKDQALDLYKKIMKDFPGSIYVITARDKYRSLEAELKNQE